MVKGFEITEHQTNSDLFNVAVTALAIWLVELSPNRTNVRSFVKFFGPLSMTFRRPMRRVDFLLTHNFQRFGQSDEQSCTHTMCNVPHDNTIAHNNSIPKFVYDPPPIAKTESFARVISIQDSNLKMFRCQQMANKSCKMKSMLIYLLIKIFYIPNG